MTGQFLICTDLDRTLLPNGAQSESVAARRHFASLASSPDIILVFVSGRDRARVEQAMRSYQLPEPDFVIGDVGTSIYDMRSQPWSPWVHWHEEIAPDWNGYHQADISHLLRGVKHLRLQEHSKQNTFKLSYYFPLHINQIQTQDEIEKCLLDRQIKATLTWSVDEPAGVGLLDILPRSASKLHAIEFLRSGLDISLGDMIFAGDSGNDLAVMASPIPSVLVANAMPSVIEEAIEAARESGNANSLYVAKGGFLEMNGNYSAGILEGIHHFHPELTRIYLSQEDA